MWRVLFGGNCDKNCLNICYSINNMALTIGNVSEVIIFAYVVYSQISFTGKQKGRKDALRNVLLCGYASVEDIEKAVLE